MTLLSDNVNRESVEKKELSLQMKHCSGDVVIKHFTTVSYEFS
jgi:hypothetical protein